MSTNNYDLFVNHLLHECQFLLGLFLKIIYCNFRTSIYSKITYDIRTSYKSFLNYLSTCTLKCTVKNYENKTIAHASIQNLLVVAQNNQLVKTLPLLNNKETVGTLKLYFNFQTFNDNSFDNVIKSLKQFGIQNKMLDLFDDKDLYDSELLKTKNNLRSTSSISVKTNRSKEELTTDYLMGKLFIYFFLLLILVSFFF